MPFACTKIQPPRPRSGLLLARPEPEQALLALVSRGQAAAWYRTNAASPTLRPL